VRIWRIAGLAFETAEAEDIGLRKNQLNTLLRSIASDQVAIWTHNIRRRTSDRLNSVFENDFCRALDRKYYDSFAGYRMMCNELYLTLVYRPAPTATGRFLKARKRTKEEILDAQRWALKQLDQLSYQIEAGLQKYGADHNGIEALSTYEKDGVLYSQPLELLNFLLSAEWHPVRVPSGPLHTYLGTSWIYVGTETIEIRSARRTVYAQGIDLKDYSAHTEPGILDSLLYSDCEYVLTQSYSYMSKPNGKDFLERQKKQLMNAEDGSLTQIDEISEAIDQLLQGRFAMGEYHFSLLIYGDSIEEVRRHTTEAMTQIQNEGFLAALISTATDSAFYAQLPCNWYYRPRIAGLTSLNFASLCGFHNFRAGKRDGNPWGQAVTLFKTPSGQPLYFNFHFSRGDEDSYDKKLLGNTRIIGASGTGKTVLMNMLLCQAQKYQYKAPGGFTTVFFDKDRGAELLIRAIGGAYKTIKNGEPTGFNPFRGLAPTNTNILFLERLVKILVGGTVTIADENRISHGVRTVMSMAPEYRRLSILLQNIAEGTSREERENSVRKRLAKWCMDDGSGNQGVLAWVFDNSEDSIDFYSHANYGFDGTEFLDNEETRTPLSLYIIYMMEQVIDGRRFIYFMDEAWKWVDDDAFAEFAGNKQLTIRKQNGIGVFSTQMPSSLLNSTIAASLVQQIATEIYLPNPKADLREYVDGFKCSPTEYELIRSLAENSHMFLVKQGQQSMLGHLDLAGFDDELAIMSGSTDNIELFDKIVKEIGYDPQVWIPEFHYRRKERVTSSIR